MQPSKCAACGGTDFNHDQYATGLAAFPRTFTNFFFEGVLAKCSVCLSCGCIAVHVDDATLEKLRARNARAKTKETVL
jgi:hypothetical protein